ncbi:15504_t:CDS:2 [Dentiscutata erythropus]|uniref:15504_t:CDS:1 n=1 Tax=Dentiscutata erythropus TaxID=1348616 RepID=A0A9N8WEX5_9GLOM|nr:15504_t:CDS:2 [Dentiscutata erythropus]
MADDMLVSNLFSVKDKIALITGGGTGIGKIIAKAFVKNVAKELTEMGPGKCFSIEADLNSKAACEKLAADFKNLGNDKLDILANNSGIGFRSALTEYSEEDWDTTYTLNLCGSTIELSSIYSFSCLPLLEKASKKPVDPSKVIIIGSILGINVNALIPGIVPVTDRTYDKNIALSEVPQGRLGDELDMAGAALYLASRAGSWVTDVEIVVDGGCLLRYKLSD